MKSRTMIIKARGLQWMDPSDTKIEPGAEGTLVTIGRGTSKDEAVFTDWQGISPLKNRPGPV